MTSLAEKAYTFIEAPGSSREQDFAGAVREGFSKKPRELSPRFFYDERGSELFEQILDLPEYYQTEKEIGILETYAGDILDTVASEVTMIEFGAGSSRKTRILLETGIERQGHLQYMPIDVSGEFLEKSAQTLTEDYEEGLWVTAIAGRYRDALKILPETHFPKLMIMLGGTVGNYREADIVDLLGRIRSAMGPEDRMLVGIDLIKDPDVIEAAYNDRQGVTAEFNKNILRRMNRELDANFDLNSFKHEAPFLEDKNRVEMRLVSTKDQVVDVGAIDKSYTFEEGEYIHTENSTKFTPSTFDRLAQKGGLTLDETWMDEEEYFALTLLRPMAE